MSLLIAVSTIKQLIGDVEKSNSQFLQLLVSAES